MKLIIRPPPARKEDFKNLRYRDPYLKSRYSFELIFNERPDIPLVYSLNPDRLNERLTIQQGVFLAPTDIARSFEDNLEELCKRDPSAENHIWKITIYDDVNLRCEILKELNRMNINSASLYPDLGGFAKSLETHVANPELLGNIK